MGVTEAARSTFSAASTEAVLVVGAPQDTAGIARGAAAMIASQLLTTPLSVVVSAVLGRRLGPSDFGAMYLAQTAVGHGFLVVDWGQSTAMAGAVARDRATAESLLGTSMALKLALGAMAPAVLVSLGILLGYSRTALNAIGILSLAYLVGSLQASGVAVLRGYERIEQVSAMALAGSVLSSLLVIAFALAGGGVYGVLWAIVLGSVLQLIATAMLVRRSGVGLPRLERAQVRMLLGQGSVFLLFNVVLATQPYIDTAFLARLAAPDVMGWYGATRRIAGVLVFPAVSLSFTMYPTLARLQREAAGREIEFMRGALRVLVLAGVPAALGSVLFAGPIVHLIYGTGRFEGAVLNLQVLSPWVLLVYFSILIGNWFIAVERVLAWSLLQGLCLVVSAAADAPLIRLCSDRLANGSVGISVSNVISEILMVGIGLSLMPRAILREGLRAAIAQAAAAGVVMTGVALALAHLPSAIAISASLVAYVAALWPLGALRGQELRDVIGMFRTRAASR